MCGKALLINRKENFFVESLRCSGKSYSFVKSKGSVGNPGLCGELFFSFFFFSLASVEVRCCVSFSASLNRLDLADQSALPCMTLRSLTQVL